MTFDSRSVLRMDGRPVTWEYCPDHRILFPTGHACRVCGFTGGQRPSVDGTAAPRDPGVTPELNEDYQILFGVLLAAYYQASIGKGRERHAEEGKAFEDQDICQEARDLGLAYPIGQARKKVKEALRLHSYGRTDQAIADALGAINYIAAAIIVMEEQRVSTSSPTQEG